MSLDVAPVLAGIAGTLVLFSTVVLVWALYGRGRRLRVLYVVVPLLLWVLVAGVPFVVPPILGGHRLPVLAGFMCVAAGAAFATLAARARRALRGAEGVPPVATAEAMARLQRGDGGSLTLEGRIEGDPPLVAPLSGVPCVGYRLHLYRKANGVEELVALEESACDRVVLADGTGKLALSVDPRGFRKLGAPWVDFSAAGVVGGRGDNPRLARVVKQLEARDSPGGSAYRAEERAVPNGAPAAAVGRVVRRGGEPILVPALAPNLSVRFGARESVTRGYRRLMFTCALLSAVCVAAGFALFASPRAEPEVAVPSEPRP